MMDYTNVNKAYKLLATLEHASVKRVVDLLLKDGEMTQLAISARLNLDYPTVQQTMIKLEKKNLVTKEKDGKYVYYSINVCKMKRIVEAIEALCSPSKVELV